MDTILRYEQTVLASSSRLIRPLTTPRLDHGRFPAILREAVTSTASSTDWDELTAHVSARPWLNDSEIDLWRDAAPQMLANVMASGDAEWMQSFESFNRLLAHPALGDVALATVRETLADTSVPSLAGTVALLESSPDLRAAIDILHHLDEPSDHRLYVGALMAAERKIVCGHFDHGQLRRISRIVTSASRKSTLAPETEISRLSLTLLARIPSSCRTQAGIRLLKDLTDILDLPTTRMIARRVYGRAVCSIRNWDGVDLIADPVLPLVIDEMLAHDVFDVRLYATQLLRASPYGQVVAEELAAELKAAGRSLDRFTTVALYEALRGLGGQREREQVEGTLLDPCTPLFVLDVASYVLGHIGGVSNATFWAAVWALHREQWRRSPQRQRVSVLDRLVYAIGRAGADYQLRDIQWDTALPASVRSAAGWWLRRT